MDRKEEQEVREGGVVEVKETKKLQLGDSEGNQTWLWGSQDLSRDKLESGMEIIIMWRWMVGGGAADLGTWLFMVLGSFLRRSARGRSFCIVNLRWS